MVTWFTVEGTTPEEATAAQERLAAAWNEAPLQNLESCGMILDVAREQVIAYAPDSEPAELVTTTLERLGYDADAIAAALAALALDPPVSTDPPTRYVYAQLQQAINLWNAGRVSSDGNLGDGGYTFTPRPLDKTIRGIIRPVSGGPDVY
jgi:hypothetical protein